MANRDLGTAILNIRVQFEKIDTKLIDAKIQQLNESITKALKSTQTATNLKESGKKIGEDFVSGFNEGIKDKQKDVEKQTTLLGRAASWFFKKSLDERSPSKITYKIGQDFVAGFILGVKSKFDTAKEAIGSIAGGSVSGLNSELDQLTVARQKLARATLLRDAEESKDPAEQNLQRIRNLERIQVNLVEEIKLIEARNQADKSYAIDKVSKRRADEIERTTKSIEKNAGASKKIAGTIVEFSRQYMKSDKTVKTFNNTVQASTRVVSEYFNKIVQGSKKTQDFQGAANELEAEYRRIRTQVKASVADQKLQVRVLAELKRAYQEQKNVLISVAEAERRAAGTRQGTKDARETVALGTTNATQLLNQIAGLNNLAQAMRLLGQDATKVDQAILVLEKRLTKISQKAISAVRGLQNQAGGLVKAYSKIQDISDKVNLNDLTSRGSGVLAVGNVGATAFKEISNQAKATGNLAKVNVQLDRALVTLIRRVRQTVRDSRLQADMIKALRRAYREATGDINKFKDSLNLKAGIQGLRQYTSGINQFGEQLRRVSFILRDVGRQMMTLGKAGLRSLLPNLEDFAKYEQAVVDVLATTGDLNNGLTKTNVLATSLSKRILDLAGTFMFSAEEIAKVSKQLALAGFSTQQIEESLDSVLQLASATGSDLTTAANIAISAMSTFGIEAEDTGRIADVFAATVTRSNTNLNQLAEAFKVVAPVASQFGQSIEETSAALGILGNAGLKGCYDGETEVLTKQGWVRWEDTTPDMIYATVNQQNHSIEFHPAKEYIKYHHEGEMVRFLNKQVDLFVTPNHNMYVKKRGKENYELIRADNLLKGDFSILTAVDNSAADRDVFILAGESNRNKGFYTDTVADLAIPFDDWVEFLGFYLSEGSYTYYTGGNYTVCISQQEKSKGYQKIKELCDRLPFKFNYHNGVFRTHSKQLFKYVRQFGRALNKYVPDYIFEASKRQIQLFLESYRLGDGDVTFRLYTASARMSKDLDRLAILAGYSTRVVTRKPRKSFINGRPICTSNPQYEVQIKSDKKSVNVSRSEINRVNKSQLQRKADKYSVALEKVKFSGLVYCVEVPNNTLIVRRGKGRAVVCGNSIAGTGLARILTQLVEKGDTLDSILKGMGSSFDALDPQKNNFSDILKEFERLNLSSSTLLEIFDLRAFRSLNAILAQGSNGLGSLVDQLERAEAVAEAISGARLQTLAASMQLLSDATTSLRISIGSLVSNEAVAFLDFLRESVVGVRAFIEENRETLAPFMKFLLTSLATLTSAGAAVFGLGSAASFAAAPFIGFGAILAGLVSVLGGVSTVSLATGISLSALLIPVAAVTAAVTGLVMLLSGLFVGTLISVAVSISNFTDKWGEFFNKVVDATAELIDNILPRLALGFSNNLYKIELASDRLIKALGLVFDPEALSSLSWESLGETVATVTAFFLEFAAVVVEDLTPSLQGLLDRIDLLIQLFDLIPTIAGLDDNVGIGASAEAVNFLRYLLTGSAGLYAVLKIYEGIKYLISITLQWFGLFESESEPAANEVDKLNQAFENQREKIANLIDEAQDYSKALTKIQPMLNNLGDATPMDLEALKDAATGGYLNKDKREEFLGQLSSQVAELERLKEGMGENSDKRFQVARRITQLEKLIQTIETIGGQFDKIQDLVANKTVPQLTEDFKKIVSEEQNKIKALEGIQDKILKMQRDTGRAIKTEDVKALARQIFQLTGETIEIDWSNPMQSLTAALRSTINNALTDSKANLEMVRRLTDILPDLGEIDLTNPKDLDRLVDAFSKVKDNSDEIAKNLKSSLDAQLKIQKEIDDLNRTAYERKREELRLQAKERKEQLKQTRETLLLEQEMLQQNLRSAEIEGKSTEAIQASIENNLANLEANRKLATKLGFGEGKPFSFQFDEDDTRMESMVDQNQELLKMDQEAREKAELDLAETRLEVETDVQKRIGLRTQLIEAKRAKELKDKIEALRSNVNLAKDRAELDRLEKATEEAIGAAKAEELRKMRDEETKDETKEQEKALDRNQEIVNKRVDLENELLSNLGKQVTTLQEMAMLMKFIEVLQRRKDQEALRSIRQLSKERQKLVRMEAAGDGSAKSQAAIKAQQDTVAFLAGVVGRNKGQAGAEGGDPRGIFNIEAFLRQLNLALDKFVGGLKQNPIEIPIKLDTSKIMEDLKKAFKGFNVDGIAGTMVQGLNMKSNLVGANFGTINHNDNSVTNINVKNFDASLAFKLGLTNG